MEKLGIRSMATVLRDSLLRVPLPLCALLFACERGAPRPARGDAARLEGLCAGKGVGLELQPVGGTPVLYVQALTRP